MARLRTLWRIISGEPDPFVMDVKAELDEHKERLSVLEEKHDGLTRAVEELTRGKGE